MSFVHTMPTKLSLTKDFNKSSSTKQSTLKESTWVLKIMFYYWWLTKKFILVFKISKKSIKDYKMDDSNFILDLKWNSLYCSPLNSHVLNQNALVPCHIFKTWTHKFDSGIYNWWEKWLQKDLKFLNDLTMSNEFIIKSPLLSMFIHGRKIRPRWLL